MKPEDLERCVLCLLLPDGKTAGAAFLVATNLAVTCAHLVEGVGGRPGSQVQVRFSAGGQERQATVLAEGWSPPEEDDVAFLRLPGASDGAQPAVLGSARGRQAHPYTALGFPPLYGYRERWVTDTVGGIVSPPVGRGSPILQVGGEAIKKGMSGAPVLDLQAGRVVGMVREFADDSPGHADDTNVRFAWATTADTLQELRPTLRLWPDAYGPAELDAYLDFLIEANRWLRLPDGREVELERIYVSLRADEMNAAEREAEHTFIPGRRRGYLSPGRRAGGRPLRP